MYERKGETVRNRKLPQGVVSGCVIKNTWDSKSRRYIFHVDAPTGETKHTIGISSEFVGENEPADIVACLKIDN